MAFGGVWVTSAPNLLFIPDANGDDVPDGAPVIVLDGWTLQAGHNDGEWPDLGPDGWLFGRHGITARRWSESQAPDDQRTRLSCSIWRYHPSRKVFGAVTHGTTNPWGLDFDDFGQPFFSNNVIGHLWHVIPGAHYQRMFGEDFNPCIYELMEACSDHLHWTGSVGAWPEAGRKMIPWAAGIPMRGPGFIWATIGPAIIAAPFSWSIFMGIEFLTIGSTQRFRLCGAAWRGVSPGERSLVSEASRSVTGRRRHVRERLE